MIVKVQVTEAIIKQAMRYRFPNTKPKGLTYAECCPVALAIKKTLNTKKTLMVNHNAVLFERNGGGTGGAYLPMKVSDFIRDYDRQSSALKPIEFELNINDDDYKNITNDKIKV